MRKPAWRKRLEADIAAAGITQEELRIARLDYETHNISLNVVPRRGWRIYGIGSGFGPTYVVCWSNLETLVKDRPAFIEQFKRLAAGIE